MVSLICPIYNEEKYIGRFIESILKQDFPFVQMEVLFVDGLSSDNTRSIIQKAINEHPFIRLIDNPHRTSPYALNIGIQASRGEYVIRMDAHAEYPTDYVSSLLRYKEELPDAENVGGICITLPTNDSTHATAISLVLSSPFGMGNSYFRTGTDSIRKVDTFPFGCFSKELFSRIGDFDTSLIRNQDDEFNGRIIKNGGSIYLIPSIRIKYYARDTIAKTRKMFYQYGLYKPLVNMKLGAPATVRQFFPLLFLIGLVIGGVLSCFSEIIRIVYFSVLLLYVFIGLVLGSMGAIRCNKPLLILYMPWVFLNVHLSYGWGYLIGILKVLGNRSFDAKVNR